MAPRSPDFLSALVGLGLEAHADLLAPYACLEIGLFPAEGAVASLGGTRVGGPADMPPGLAWPCHRWPLSEVETWPAYAKEAVDEARRRGQVRDEAGELVAPLVFVMQVDLEEVAPYDREHRLPGRGLLLFFASLTTDIEDPLFTQRIASAVIHVDHPRAALCPTPQPPAADFGPDAALALRPAPHLEWDIPYEDWPALEVALPAPAYAVLGCEARRQVDALFAAPREECAGPMPPPGEVALLRLHEHDQIGFYVGDASWITFAIPASDLAERRFDAARASCFIG